MDESDAAADRPDSPPPMLRVNHNRVLMQGRRGVVELELSAVQDACSAEITLICADQLIEAQPRQLRIAGTRRLSLQVTPAASGEIVCSLRVRLTFPTQTLPPRCYESGDLVFRVYEPQVSGAGRSVRIHIDNSLHAGHDLMGNSVRAENDLGKQVHEALRGGRTINDLLDHPFPDNWVMTELDEVPVAPVDAPTLGPDAAGSHPPRRVALVTLDRQLHLFAGDELSFGRDSRLNDVTLRLLPFNEQNRQSSGRFSSRHFRVAVVAGVVQVTDLQSTGGTVLNGLPLLPGVPAPVRSPATLRVAGSLSLRIVPVVNQRHALAGVLVERMDNHPEQSYVLISGSIAVASLGLPGGSDQIVRRDNVLWLNPEPQRFNPVALHALSQLPPSYGRVRVDRPDTSGKSPDA